MSKKYKVFFDSNVIISGLISQKASPFLVLKAAEDKKFQLYSGNFILAELERNLAQKAPHALVYLWMLWNKINPIILPLTNRREIDKYKKIINYLPDQVILAVCEKNKIDYLVTLDKKHLLKQNIHNQVNVKIIRPEELIEIITNVY